MLWVIYNEPTIVNISIYDANVTEIDKVEHVGGVGNVE